MQTQFDVVRRQNDVISQVVGECSSTQLVLDIESTSTERIDAHVGLHTVLNRTHPSWDCSHYCLPGLPDLWNAMLATILCERYV